MPAAELAEARQIQAEAQEMDHCEARPNERPDLDVMADVAGAVNYIPEETRGGGDVA